MRISHFFIDRPIFAAVVSIAFVILGAVAYFRLPVAQYPEIAPPIINVTGQYPGASADVVAATVVAPLEQQINGVENMLYISSNSTGDGRFSISVTFDLGTNLDIAQVQVQNRVAIAQPRLPADVRNIGVTVAKASPDLMMVVHLYSPDQSRDTLFISNYANVQVTDALSRIYGVGSVIVFGARDYSMRVWLNPDRLQSLGLTPGDVVKAVQGQNVQVASGVLNQPPVAQPRAFQLAVRTLGRLADPNEFANIVVKQSANAVVRLQDVARVELAAVDYTTNSYLDRDPAIAIGIFQLPGSNALATAEVENVERNIAAGLPPHAAARRSMDEVGSALIAIALVLCAVFVPSAFITGISGQFYRQFALTIAGATVISLIVSLTLSPAMCALLLKPHEADHRDRWWERPIHGFFRAFNFGFDALGRSYGWLTARIVRFAAVMLLLYAGVIALGLNEFRRTPQGFIPQQDAGYLIIVTQLPSGAALVRTDEVNRRAADIALDVPGVAHAVNIVGFSGATFTNAPNSGAIFVVLDPFETRARDPQKSAAAIQGQLFQRLSTIQEGFIVVVAPPPVRGIGNAGGFRMMIQDRSGHGSEALQQTVFAMMGRAAHTPGVTQVFSLFETSTPQLYLDIDRTKAQMLGINISDVFSALQTYLGSYYVNDFNLLGRTFR